MENNGMQVWRANDRQRNDLIASLGYFVPQPVRQRGSVTGDLFMRFAFQQLDGKDFRPQTLGPALLTFAMLGLMPNPALGLGYLIPYKGTVTAVIGYKGWQELARRARPEDGRVLLDCRSDVVCQGEDFAPYERGVEASVLGHVPKARDIGSLDGVQWAYADFKYGVPFGTLVHEYHVIELMERDTLMGVRATSATMRMRDRAKQAQTPWFKWPHRMAQKLPISRLCRSGRVPLGYLAGAVSNASERAEAGDLAGFRTMLHSAMEDARADMRAKPGVGMLEDGFAAIDVDNEAGDDDHGANGSPEPTKGPLVDWHAYERDIADILAALDSIHEGDQEERAITLHKRGVAIAEAHNVQRPDRLNERFDGAIKRIRGLC
jgi:hypothetical protein